MFSTCYTAPGSGRQAQCIKKIKSVDAKSLQPFWRRGMVAESLPGGEVRLRTGREGGDLFCVEARTIRGVGAMFVEMPSTAMWIRQGEQFLFFYREARDRRNIRDHGRFEMPTLETPKYILHGDGSSVDVRDDLTGWEGSGQPSWLRFDNAIRRLEEAMEGGDR